ncbi:MAG: adenylyl-sulfate kinase, partial [Xanthobacteraceae bacterium]|nr:adenylyl-sulfate kinase [Xanthobacteraceae bacterium]
ALKNFTGVDQPYEAPEHPDVHLRADQEVPQDQAERVIAAAIGRVYYSGHRA